MKRKIKVFIKIFFILAVVSVLSVCAFNYAHENVIPVIVELSRATIENYVVDAVNAAAHMVIDENIDYKSLVSLEKDKNGDVLLVQCNTVKINRLARDLANLAQANVDKIVSQTLFVPLGAFTGSVILSGKGPDVKIKLLPIGSVICDFKSVFESVGVNQTKHSIYINVGSEISIVLPINTAPVAVTMSVLVAENVIIGKVPNVYISGSSTGQLTDKLALVPIS